MGGVCGGDITQQCARSTGIKDGSERGTPGEAPHQPFLKRLEERKVSISTLQQVERHEIRTLSLILFPPRATRTGITECSVYINRSRA